MQYMNLGPNGAMLFCMEFIEKHVEDIIEKINQKSDHYFLIDCPGQVRIRLFFYPFLVKFFLLDCSQFILVSSNYTTSKEFLFFR